MASGDKSDRVRRFFDLGFDADEIAKDGQHLSSPAPSGGLAEYALLLPLVVVGLVLILHGLAPWIRRAVFAESQHPGADLLTQILRFRWIVASVCAIFGLGLLAVLTSILRSLANPIPWQVACWALLALGILSRQLLLGGQPPGHATVEATTVRLQGKAASDGATTSFPAALDARSFCSPAS